MEKTKFDAAKDANDRLADAKAFEALRGSRMPGKRCDNCIHCYEQFLPGLPEKVRVCYADPPQITVSRTPQGVQVGQTPRIVTPEYFCGRHTF